MRSWPFSVFRIVPWHFSIFAEIPKFSLWFKRVAGPLNSHYRWDSQVFSLIQAFGWHSRFALTLRFPSVDSSVWLALKIRIIGKIPKCFLWSMRLTGTQNVHDTTPTCFLWFKRLTCTQNPYYRWDSQMFSVIQAFDWRSKFVLSMRFPSIFCDSRVWLALQIRIDASIPKFLLCFKRWTGTQCPSSL